MPSASSDQKKNTAPLVAGDDADAAAWVPLADVAGHDLVDGLAEFLTHHGVIAG